MSLDLTGHRLTEIIARATAEPGTGHLAPAVCKEIIHYAVFDYLDEFGYLDMLTFQGGTCLRDCYGSPRLSEDLDFNVPPEFDFDRLDPLAEDLRTRLTETFGLSVKVKPPSERRMSAELGVPLAKWVIAIETDPQDPSLPLQRAKLEVAKIPAYEPVDRFLMVRQPLLPSSLSDIVIVCESLEEICADKIVSFAASPYARHRDLWDLRWMMAAASVNLERTVELVSLKVDDYGLSDRWASLAAAAGERASIALSSREFAAEMVRFIPSDSLERTVNSPRWIRASARLLSELYGTAGPSRTGHARKENEAKQ